MSSYKGKIMVVMATGMLVMALGGCHKEGPAEKAGKQVDKAMSNAGDQIQAAGDKVQNALK